MLNNQIRIPDLCFQISNHYYSFKIKPSLWKIGQLRKLNIKFINNLASIKFGPSAQTCFMPFITNKNALKNVIECEPTILRDFSSFKSDRSRDWGMIGLFYFVLFKSIWANFPRPTIFPDGFTPQGECYIFPWNRVHLAITQMRPQ